MISYRFDHLLSAGRWLSPGYVSADEAGRIARASGDAPEGDCRRISGIAIPGVPNVHSHAFQRAMAGLAERPAGAGKDSFWTWRETMYRFVAAISPDEFEAIAAQVYVEMLKSGYTSVGEFQYLHHDRDGAPFADPGEMTLRAAAAARKAGIAATLLPVLYQNGGFGGAPPQAGQRRFVNDVDRFMRICESVAAACAGDPDLTVGIAPHSLRAVGEEALRTVEGAVGPSAPIHIHIAEQEREVVDCEAWSGLRPVQWLLEKIPVDERWCLVHVTHMTPDEVRAAAGTGATAGLCPTTEANLGDGLFDLPSWRTAGGRIAVGSDSNVSVDPVEELRWLEYGQRLRDRRRNVAGDARRSTGAALFEDAVRGGLRALGRGEGLLQEGGRADIVVLDAEAPPFAGRDADAFLDSWIFSGNRPVVRDAIVGGAHVVRDGAHAREQEIAAAYRAAMRRLLAS